MEPSPTTTPSCPFVQVRPTLVELLLALEEEGREERRLELTLLPVLLPFHSLQLPTETIRDIFDYVKDEQDRIRLAQTCKRFKKARRYPQRREQDASEQDLTSLFPPLVLFYRSSLSTSTLP